MQFSPENVIALLYIAATFQNLSQSSIINIEREMKEKIENVLRGMYDDQFEIEQEESLDFENSFDIPEAKLIEEEEWNKQEENNEREEKSYYVKEIACV